VPVIAQIRGLRMILMLHMDILYSLLLCESALWIMSTYIACGDGFVEYGGTLDEISENEIYPNLQNYNCGQSLKTETSRYKSRFSTALLTLGAIIELSSFQKHFRINKSSIVNTLSVLELLHFYRTSL
jgi:hypothetical protein